VVTGYDARLASSRNKIGSVFAKSFATLTSTHIAAASKISAVNVRKSPLLWCVLHFSLVAISYAANVFNGSFAWPGGNPGTLTDGSPGRVFSPGSTSIAGWTVTDDIVGYNGAGRFNPAPGDADGYSVEIGAGFGSGGIQQTFPTKPNTPYVVSFYLAAYPGSSGSAATVTVSAAGQWRYIRSAPSPGWGNTVVWERRHFYFVSDETGRTTLKFRNVAPPPVVPTPTPYPTPVLPPVPAVVTQQALQPPLPVVTPENFQSGAEVHGAVQIRPRSLEGTVSETKDSSSMKDYDCFFCDALSVSAAEIDQVIVTEGAGSPAANAVVFQNVLNGRPVLRAVSGSQYLSTSVLSAVPSGWKIAGAGDFNRDGEKDLVWQDSDRRLVVWYLNRSAFGSAAGIGVAPVGWSVVAVADFNHDARADLVFQNDAGAIAIWTMGGSAGITRQATYLIPQTDRAMRVVAVTDFNVDGAQDLVFQKAGGETSVWLMSGKAPFRKISERPIGEISSDWRVAGAADFNFDGNPDLLFQNAAGALAVYLMGGLEGTTHIGSSWLPATTSAWQVRAIK
jgi:hypothetical protein